MNKHLDLHIHSTYSDSSMTVEDIVKNAKERQIDLIAITDHNTFDSFHDLKQYAYQYNQDALLGIELSTLYKQQEIHVLGYFSLNSDETSPKMSSLKDIMTRYRGIKTTQNEAMINKISQDYPTVTIDDFYHFVQSDNINRVHIAKYLIQKTIASSIQDAFDHYIGEDCPYYVDKESISVKQAIDAIHQAGGLAIIAHMGEYHFNKVVFKQFVEYCIKGNIDGFECYHPSNTPAMRQMILSIPDVIFTMGSDDHGINKVNHQMGIDYGIFEDDKQKQQFETIQTQTYNALKKCL